MAKAKKAKKVTKSKGLTKSKKIEKLAKEIFSLVGDDAKSERLFKLERQFEELSGISMKVRKKVSNGRKN